MRIVFITYKMIFNIYDFITASKYDKCLVLTYISTYSIRLFVARRRREFCDCFPHGVPDIRNDDEN